MPAQATINGFSSLPKDGKAEPVNGQVQPLPPAGSDPGYAGDEIFAALREYARRAKFGRAVGDNTGFRVALLDHGSFSPDAALYVGPNHGMKFDEGAPRSAIDVRGEGDYGTVAESAIRAIAPDTSPPARSSSGASIWSLR